MHEERHTKHRSRLSRVLIAAAIVLVFVACAIVGIRYHQQMKLIDYLDNSGGMAVTELEPPQWLRKLIGDHRMMGFETIWYIFLRKGSTDKDFVAIAGQTDLRGLDASQSNVTDEGLRSLSNMKSLLSLTLDSPNITEEGVSMISVLSRLTELNLTDSHLTDDGLRRIEELKELTSLRIAKTQITDEGLQSLSRLPALRELDLSHTQITDRGLTHLDELKHLEVLHLEGTNVTANGVVHVRKAHPGVSIPSEDNMDANRMEVYQELLKQLDQESRFDQ